MIAMMTMITAEGIRKDKGRDNRPLPIIVQAFFKQAI